MNTKYTKGITTASMLTALGIGALSVWAAVETVAIGKNDVRQDSEISMIERGVGENDNDIVELRNSVAAVLQSNARIQGYMEYWLKMEGVRNPRGEIPPVKLATSTGVTAL